MGCGASSSPVTPVDKATSVTPAPAPVKKTSLKTSTPDANTTSKPKAKKAMLSDDYKESDQKKLTQFYDVAMDKLGSGAFGTVSTCTNKTTGLKYALKSIGTHNMKLAHRKLLEQEIAVMNKFDHPNIVKLYDTFEDARNQYLVLEICSGGELFDRIVEMGAFTEKLAAVAMKQILGGVSYMHNLKVCHRDIKPENFLLSTSEPLDVCTLKIIDFGLSCTWTPGTPMSTKAGTLLFVAPQVLGGSYDEKSDLWSCGVVMHILLCGCAPFQGEDDDET